MNSYEFPCLFLFPRTLSGQGRYDGHVEKSSKVDHRSEDVGENIYRMDIRRLEETLQAEREERRRLELEKEELRHEKQILEEQRERAGGRSWNSICCSLMKQVDLEKL